MCEFLTHLTNFVFWIQNEFKMNWKEFSYHAMAKAKA